MRGVPLINDASIVKQGQDCQAALAIDQPELRHNEHFKASQAADFENGITKVQFYNKAHGNTTYLFRFWLSMSEILVGCLACIPGLLTDLLLTAESTARAPALALAFASSDLVLRSAPLRLLAVIDAIAALNSTISHLFRSTATREKPVA
ncbi:hypothetical protein TgHK011_005518 [Trichoderma gracile]|nr:hypothetical protein TgHK011_005518 [Trichoderma gracile]